MALSDPKKDTKPKFKAVINKLGASVGNDTITKKQLT